MATKNYMVNKIETSEVHYKESAIPTNEFRMYGKSSLELWGGDKGSIEMDDAYFKADELTRAVMYANLNDGQFGCQNIISARVLVEQKIIKRRMYADEDNKSTDIIEWVCVADDLRITRAKDFDSNVGDPLRGIGRGGYTYKEKE